MKSYLQDCVMLGCLLLALTDAGPAIAQYVAVAHRDPVLGTRFVTVRNSAHPEWPARTEVEKNAPALTTDEASLRPALKIELPVVRAGQAVRLWMHESGLQVEVSGVAEDNGALGQRIRVRLTAMSGTNQPPQEIAGVVRGAESVEMMQ